LTAVPKFGHNLVTAKKDLTDFYGEKASAIIMRESLFLERAVGARLIFELIASYR
jgi:hypothetical protein